MLEMMLMSNRKPKIQYPNSGPGPKTLLFGDEQLGYFGELTSASFLTVPELQRQLNFYSGVPSNVNMVWVKVFSEGTVLYIPKQPVATDISWETLYGAGLVFGVDGPGLPPDSTPVTPAVNQLMLVAAGGRQLKVRLFKNSLTENNQVVTWTDPDTQLSEWPKLSAAMITQVPNAPGTPKWNIYNNENNLFAASEYTSTQSSGGPSRIRTMTNNAVSRVVRPDIIGRTWFPVLELLPTEKEYVLPVFPTYSLTQMTTTPTFMLEPEHTFPLAVQRTTVKVQLNPVTMTNISSVEYE